MNNFLKNYLLILIGGQSLNTVVTPACPATIFMWHNSSVHSFFFVLIEVELINNVVLVSGV